MCLRDAVMSHIWEKSANLGLLSGNLLFSDQKLLNAEHGTHNYTMVVRKLIRQLLIRQREKGQMKNPSQDSNLRAPS